MHLFVCLFVCFFNAGEHRSSVLVFLKANKTAIYNAPVLMLLIVRTQLNMISPSIGLTNLAKPYHVHYHLSQPDMAGQNTLGWGAALRAAPQPRATLRAAG